ncbi:hypothetical protein SOPP22_00085 [Shewanella sp. OPT22]|nr:hypothetical protein SOPP22_00085 [Shewanella sp. OPT22]
MKNNDVTQLIADISNDNIQQIMDELRALIFEVTPDVNESIKWSRPVYSVNGDCFYLQPNKAHVNLGFFNFDKITVGAEHLEGTGKNMRHVKLKSLEQISALPIAEMLKQAV